ncbi:MAG: hypothetical protein ACKN9T_07620 [Candidatus Methylumidiphilus sp.]
MKLITFASVLAVLLGLMAYTNPTLGNYEGFINRMALQEADKQPDLQASPALVFGGFPSRWVAAQTRREDYVFLSVYEASLGDEHIRAVGLFNNFILTEKPEALARR